MDVNITFKGVCYDGFNYEHLCSMLGKNVVDNQLSSQRWSQVREQRDKLLRETDWALTIDSPVDAETIEALKIYRQSLRNIPQDYTDPESVIWPQLPLIK
ncbi:TPA: phage tail assembly chaperone [Vibrio parahaemolyticus]|nr:phage tail assembly chaperone [Vibrio parahaemolyticus]HCH0731069.1 phage tail assembly chaperone [Vibrio parahaemolyticus]